jgi:drug/metabolite transporter (DMT)-like permease
LLLTTTPLWMVLFNWWRPKGVRPPALIWFGLIVGFGATAALAFAGQRDGNKEIDLFGVAALMFASIAWALGSVIVKHGPRPDSPVLGTAQQMLCGGAVLVVFSASCGELNHFQLGQVTLRSFLGFAYLLVVGSLLTMPVYTWLLHSTEPSLVSTYSFVNPVIAVIIGWAFADEKLTGATILAGGVIVLSVAWLIAVQWRYSHSNRAIRNRVKKPAVQEVAS